MKDHWTAEEYRRFLETRKMPEEEPKKLTAEEIREIVEAHKHPTPQAEIEAAWRKAEREGRIMEMDVPVDGPEQGDRPHVPLARNMGTVPRVPNAGRNPTNSQPPIPPKRRKYGNEITWVDGIRFDSKHEAAVYQELMLRVKAGELKCVCRQVRFDLGGGPNATKESRYQYIADFVTIDPNGTAEVIDAKSEITRKNPTYRNKKKDMLALWGIEIQEV